MGEGWSVKITAVYSHNSVCYSSDLRLELKRDVGGVFSRAHLADTLNDMSRKPPDLKVRELLLETGRSGI